MLKPLKCEVSLGPELFDVYSLGLELESNAS